MIPRLKIHDMFISLRRSFLLFATCLLIAYAQQASAQDKPLDFAHDVLPILKKHCAECHTDGEYKGSFSLDTREAILEGENVVVGKPAESYLIERVKESDPELRMPPAEHDPLSKKEVAVLERWVDAGLPWEAGFSFKSSLYEPPLALRPVELPPARAGREHPVDRLIDAYLAEYEHTPPESISDPQFMRRVSLDLVGLPPDAEKIKAFNADPDPNKRERLIDDLLADEHAYAQHWLVFWNDLLRNNYKGTGYIDGGRKQISQWLYQALVDNKPYNQFVHELISPQPESEGFIKGIKWRGDVNASQKREIQFAQNVGQVFLGINLKCASCHDSFIDNWTLEQTYALASIYSQEKLEIHRCDKPLGKYSEPAFLLFPELGTVEATASQPDRLRQLADLLTSEQNGRLSRTIVNRLWHRLMGRGIVHPVDAMGTRPWSEELLNYLATDFVEHGWDLKHTLRRITTSKAYQSQTTLLSESPTTEGYVYAGPIAKRLTAEQFVDALWKVTQAGPTQPDAPINFSGSEIQLAGKWIWGFSESEPNVPAAGEQRTFRHRFELQELPQAAHLIATADNSYVAYLNNKQVLQGKNWGQPNSANVTGSLKVGENEILIVVTNAGETPNPAGLFAELHLVNQTQESEVISTGIGWEWSDAVPEKGELKAFSASAEFHANVFVFDEHPWSSATPAIRTKIGLTRLPPGAFIRASLVNSDLLQRSLGRPNREQVVTSRPELLTTLQAIDLANGPLIATTIQRGASNLANRFATQSKTELTNHLFLELLGRAPTREESDLVSQMLGDRMTRQGIEDLLWVLMMHPEFQLIR